MTLKELHKQLKEAYTVDNLNNICLALLKLYKSKEYSKLQNIAELISGSVTINISNEGKGFSKLMMLYHPDRALFHINKINQLAALENFDGLLEYSHIFKLEGIHEITEALENYEDIDYSPVYEWDFEAEGFSIIHESDPVSSNKTHIKGVTFYNAIKIREYGHTNIEYPPYYLHDTDEFELSSCYINDLDGIQFCIHANSIDVSNNKISDLTLLIGLKRLEELNLSDNKIGYIDVLGRLPNLKSVQLANNYLEDVSPLFELDKLEYVNLSGNRIPKEQIKELTDLGVTVDN